MTTEAFDLRKLKLKLWKRYSLSKADRDYVLRITLLLKVLAISLEGLPKI